LLKKAKEGGHARIFFLSFYLLSFIDLPLLITQTVLSYGMDARLVNTEKIRVFWGLFLFLFFFAIELLSFFDLQLVSYIMDASLVSTEKILAV
jgi:hypothetical protein